MHMGEKGLAGLYLRVTKGVVQAVRAVIEGEIISSCGSQGSPGAMGRLGMGSTRRKAHIAQETMALKREDPRHLQQCSEEEQSNVGIK